MKRRDLRVVRGSEKYPFSSGALVESLQGAGVLTDDAIAIVRDTEKHYLAGDTKRIPVAELVKYLADAVEERVSPEVARRLKRQTPPFAPVLVVGGDTEEPFSRRVLAASLEKLGIDFKEANATAHRVEAGLRAEGFERITEGELAHRVALALEVAFGRETRLRFEGATHQATELLVQDGDAGETIPFSRGILAQSMMAVAVGPDMAYNLAKQVEEVLYRFDEPRVSRASVRTAVTHVLRREAGEEFARRYTMLRRLRHPDKPIVVLVGGAPGVGKSAIASEIGYRLGIRRSVSTDSLRQALRSLISAELSPVLHSSTYAAWQLELLPGEAEGAKPKRKRVLRGFLAQVQQLDPAICGVIERNITESTSVVMEGAHLVPGVSPGREYEEATVIEMVLAVRNEDDHRQHFARREGQTGKRRQRDAYLEHFEEIRILHDYIVDQAAAEGVPVIDAVRFDRAVERGVEYVLDELLIDQPAPGEERDEARGAPSPGR